jgi:hypothetical protein
MQLLGLNQRMRCSDVASDSVCRRDTFLNLQSRRVKQ